MFERYAIFYTPMGALADFGARWLGWDSVQSCTFPHLEIADTNVADVTQTPRKYGLHGTLKAPFQLAKGCELTQLQDAATTFAAGQAAFEIGTLDLRYENGFVALRPRQAQIDLQRFAATTVKAFDAFRAPLTAADIARRRATKLTMRQDQQMLEWGYPFIFDDFQNMISWANY